MAADKVFTLGLAVGPGPMVLFLCAMVFLFRYRLTRERHVEIVRELQQRRAQAVGSE